MFPIQALISSEEIKQMRTTTKCQYIFSTALIFLLLISGCGPSAEQIATQTASAWTPTPPPTAIPTATATATPIPYDLTVAVVDEAGAPIAGAGIVFPESGDGSPKQADDQGQYSWNNLASGLVSLVVTAQGYLTTDQSSTLQRGPNEVAVTMKRDPFGLLPSASCAPDQKVLYVEDFQDGQAQGWPQITLGVDGDMPNGWKIIDENGNKILNHANAPSGSGSLLEGYTFDNFVWHLKFKVIGKDADMFFMWRLTNPGPEAKRYAAVMSAQQRPWMVRFFGGNVLNTAEASVIPKEDQWYNFDVAYFNGTHQVWMDGMKFMEYKDPQPYPEGAVGFETHLDQSKRTQFFIDDLVICELTAPYEPPQ
jgi:hypothetical protein